MLPPFSSTMTFAPFCAAVVPMLTRMWFGYPHPPQGRTITPRRSSNSATWEASYGISKNTKFAWDFTGVHPIAAMET